MPPTNAPSACCPELRQAEVQDCFCIVGQLTSAMYPYADSSSRKSHLEDYSKIAKAVLAGDASKAEKEMSGHVGRMIDSVQGMPDSAFPRAYDR